MKKLITPALTLSLSVFLVTNAQARVETRSLKSFSGAANAAQQCQRLAQENERIGVRTLVVGFEGLAQYRQHGVNTVYNSLDAKRRGQVAVARGGSGLLAGQLLLPLVSSHGKKIEVLVFGETDMPRMGSDSAPEACAVQWMRNPKNRLLILGHSNGAQAAARLASALERKRINVDAVITLDGVPFNGMVSRTKSSKYWGNVYQSLPSPLPGSAVSGADNLNLSGKTGHGGLPGHGSTVSFVRKRLDILTQ